ncbi:cytochrome aa3 quinol oxidase subunit II [Alicyclobacillus cycloheptanicus]|uniref:Cytochrome aa3-600 menaquinol oxidase subunit 2 n=1 Tax=Alicyclobacillus cycloheptanicus TaxID=1457 RepID=A0ABT9XHE9_9BACL|nr:cytochrome c oxidase subunit II transmembrane domain-containing protein [Alicyclobacillus cycloheptanicus]MDQ0189726.1 cytochrome aa3-600 menaquinol oxidase subunit 2 [Alicyclobacillus cycloheptanicus]WDM01938.1 cytochrome aa3 quinol oxidase subunit II [Alicyclobacillus cycloheptanicus]
MRPNRRWWTVAAAAVALPILLTGCGASIPVLQPKGPVGHEELKLIIFPLILMTCVALIVFAIFAYVMIKYRARPENADYVPPETDGSSLLETIWTVIPVLIVVAIAIPTVIVTFRLQKPPTTSTAPAKTVSETPAAASMAAKTKQKPLVIYVASAEWKWLFSYPQLGIETVNYLYIPAGQPVDFQLTAIGPMNSFWIPALGGMEMDMPGEDLGLWLQADQPGKYLGRSAQYSGSGFAHMTFNVYAKTPAEFYNWAANIKAHAPQLTTAKYESLLKPGQVGTMAFSGDINPNNYNGSKDMTGMPGIASGMPIPGTVSPSSNTSSSSMSGMSMSGDNSSGSMGGKNQ